ncbi:hypothetical protein [Clostridium botulinum]|uniref:hypothetical protein n=1 Tax=Clostridium botulinum TaxID=1491 RepID=UPI00131A9E2B|nr:hypothetical protein [Clostridium botulinum]
MILYSCLIPFLFYSLGIYGISQSVVYGTGSLVVGAVADISNCANLKRINRKK